MLLPQKLRPKQATRHCLLGSTLRYYAAADCFFDCKVIMMMNMEEEKSPWRKIPLFSEAMCVADRDAGRADMDDDDDAG